MEHIFSATKSKEVSNSRRGKIIKKNHLKKKSVKEKPYSYKIHDGEEFPAIIKEFFL